MTPSGIEPATFRFVAQYLNHCANAVPHIMYLIHLYQKVHIDTTAQFGITHGNQLGYSNQTLRGFISNLATTCNTRTPPTATEESAKQQAATTAPKLHAFWKAVSGQ